MAESAGEAGTPEQQREEQQPQQEPQQRGQKNLIGGGFGSRRLLLFLAVLVIELTVFFTAMAFPLDPAQQRSLNQEGQQLVQSVNSGGPLRTVSGVFLDNSPIAPVAGVPLVR